MSTGHVLVGKYLENLDAHMSPLPSSTRVCEYSGIIVKFSVTVEN